MGVLTGKVAIVTGAGQGLGEAIATVMAREGAKVMLADVNQVQIQQVADRICAEGLEAMGCGVDVSDQQQVRLMVEKTAEVYGDINILVNNAGIIRDGMIHKLSMTDWQQVLAVHITGTFNCIQAVAPWMRRERLGNRSGGKIINITSAAGLNGNVGQINYAAAKSAILGITKTVAREWARFGVCVNAVAPIADTAMTQAVPPERKKTMLAGIPLGRFGDPLTDIAPVIAFLASDAASYITGQTICIDGGRVMR